MKLYKTKLDNGLNIVIENITDAKTVTIKYVVAAGSLDETGSYNGKNNFGSAHFCEHLLFKGTKTRTFDDINNDIAKIGGVTNAYTSFSETAFFISSPTDVWKENLNILSDLFWNSTFPEEEFEKEKNVIIEELKMYNDDASDKVQEQLTVLMHPEDENRQHVAGTIPSVKALTLEQVKQFYKQFYVPNNVLLVISGNVPMNECIAEIISIVQDKESKFLPSRINEYNNMVLDNKMIRTQKNDTEQAHFAFALVGVPPYDHQLGIMEIIASLLGGGFTSRLYNIIREQKGLAYTVHVSTGTLRDSGFIEGYIGLDASNIKEVHSIIAKELNRLKRELVPDDELQTIKSLYKGKTLLAFETVSSRTLLHESNFINNTNYTLDDIIQQIEEVTPEDIQRFAKKYFIRNNICFSVVEPMSK